MAKHYSKYQVGRKILSLCLALAMFCSTVSSGTPMIFADGDPEQAYSTEFEAKPMTDAEIDAVEAEAGEGQSGGAEKTDADLPDGEGNGSGGETKVFTVTTQPEEKADDSAEEETTSPAVEETAKDFETVETTEEAVDEAEKEPETVETTEEAVDEAEKEPETVETTGEAVEEAEKEPEAVETTGEAVEDAEKEPEAVETTGEAVEEAEKEPEAVETTGEAVEEAEKEPEAVETTGEAVEKAEKEEATTPEAVEEAEKEEATTPEAVEEAEKEEATTPEAVEEAEKEEATTPEAVETTDAAVEAETTEAAVEQPATEAAVAPKAREFKHGFGVKFNDNEVRKQYQNIMRRLLGFVWDLFFNGGKATEQYLTDIYFGGVVPKDTTAEVKAISTKNLPDEIKSDALVAYDITLTSEDEEYQPEEGEPLSVSISNDVIAEAINAGKELAVWHVADDKTISRVKVLSVEGDTITFEAESFSIYVVGETEKVNRLFVSFMSGDTTRAAVYVKQDDDMDQVLYDPGVGTLGDKIIFKGWTTDEAYTATTPALSIEEVRDEVESIVSAGGFEDGTPRTYYAILLKQYTMTYIDNEQNFNASLGQEAVLYRADAKDDDLKQSYKVNMAYTPADDEHNFEGWLVKDGGSNIVGYDPEANPQTETNPSGESIKLGTIYPNGTVITVTGDVTFSVNAPEGRWLVFDENGKGGTYNAPQFILTGETTSTPTAVMTRNGYTFDGWYYFPSGVTVPKPDSNKSRDLTNALPFTFGNELTERTTVYAKWNAIQNASYTVLIWTESADSTEENKKYDFMASKIIDGGTVGATIESMNDIVIVENTDSDYVKVDGAEYYVTGFAFAGYGSVTEKDEATGEDVTTAISLSDITINPEGDTVVNIYYDRLSYTLKFYYARSQRQGGTTTYQVPQFRSQSGGVSYFNGTNGTWVGNGNTQPVSNYGDGGGTETRGNYTYYYRTLTAKYGASIGDLWPEYETDFENYNGFRLGSWAVMEGSLSYTRDRQGTIKGKIAIMNEEILGDLNTRTDNYVFGSYDRPTAQYAWVYHIYFQNLSGGYDLYEDVNALSHDSGTNWQSQQHPPAYSGMEEVRRERVGNNREINYYYNRLAYKINFMDGVYADGNNNTIMHKETIQLGVVEDVPFGTSLSSYESTRFNCSENGYVFEGWFMDEGCTSAFNFNTTLPVGGVTVYAKWRQIQYRVFLHPNAGTDTTLDWGSETQAMNFRISYGGKVSAPMGTRTGYTFVGWYLDTAMTKVFNADAYILNETNVTTPYDKTSHFTDPMDKWGNGATWNSDLIGNNGEDRFWITKELNLYAKWRSQIDGAAGIGVVYSLTDPDAGTGSGTAEDNNIYVDNAKATAVPAVTAPDGYVFDYWVMQKWDGNDYVDDTSAEPIYPGDEYDIHDGNAKQEIIATSAGTQNVYETDNEDRIILYTLEEVQAANGVVDGADPYTVGHYVKDGQMYKKIIDIKDIVKIDEAVYTIQLRAEYKPVEEATPTHIYWFDNTGVDAVQKDTTGANGPLQINEAVEIAEAPSREGYKFLGWAKIDIGDSAEAANVWEAESGNWTQNLTSADLYLYYAEDGTYHTGSITGTTASAVAADEETPYQAMFAIWAPEVTAVITGSEKTEYYDGTEKINTEYAITYYVAGTEVEELPAGVSFTISPSAAYASGTEVGTYTTTLSGVLESSSEDYVIPENAVTTDSTYNGVITLNIELGSFTVTIIGNTGEKTYTGETFTVTGYEVECTASGFNSSAVLYGGTAEVTGSAVGEYPMELDADLFSYDNPNIDVTFVVSDGGLKINPAEMTITINGNKAEENYDGDAKAASGYEATSSSILFDESKITFTGTAEVTATNVGTYEMGLTTSAFGYSDGNIEVTFVVNDGELKINPATVTVTAEDKTKAYGDDDPELTATVSGLQGSDNADLIQYSLDREEGEDVGEYTITPTGEAVQGNYNVVYETGTLTITKADVTLQVFNYEGVYDGQGHTVQVSVSGITGEVQLLYVYGDNNPSLTNPEFTEVGRYEVTVSINDNNIQAAPATGTVIINPRPVTITAKDANKVYSGTPLTAESAGYEVADRTTDSGLLDGHSIRSITLEGSITDVGTTAAIATNASIVDTTGKNVTGNYDISYIDGVLTITPNDAKIIIAAVSDSKVYDGEALTSPVAVVTTVPTDFAFTVEYVVSGSAVNVGTVANKVVSYNIKDATGADITGNFNASDIYVTDGALTITARPITITAISDSKVYDGQPLTNGNIIEPVENLVDGDTLDSVTVTGSQTLVGSSDNTPSGAKITQGQEDVTSNYAINYVAGKLTVTDGTGPNDKEPVDDDLVVTKEADQGPYSLGDEVTFNITATNIYDEAQTITLSEIEGVKLAKSTFENVAPGATIETTASYIIVEADLLNGGFTNTVTAAVGNIEKTATAAVITEEPNGHLTVTKETTSETPTSGYALGDTIEYKITVTNDGNVTITDVIVTDELEGIEIEESDSYTLRETGSVLINSIKPGDSVEIIASYTVTENDIVVGSVTNKATAEGTSPDPDDPEVPTSPGSIVTPTEDPKPSLNVTKEAISTPANGEAYVYGEVITYKITVSNDGNLTITDIQVIDDLDGVEIERNQSYFVDGKYISIDALEPGESVEITATYKVTEADVSAGSIKNSATADGTSPAPDVPTDPGEGDETVTTEAIKITITADSAEKAYDGTALIATGASITEGELLKGHEPTITTTGSQIEVGESDNVPSATIYDPQNKKDVTAAYEITYVNGKLKVTEAIPVEPTKTAITITADSAKKVYDSTALTVTGAKITEGELAEGHTLESVTVTGSQTLVGTSASVASNAKIVADGKDVTELYEITYVDGVLEVTDGTGDGEDPVPDELVVTKNSEKDKVYHIGDTITWTIKVRNIYDEAKDIKLIEKSGVTLAQDTFEKVGPGVTIETTATHVVTLDDIKAGTYDNKVSVEFGNENIDPTGEDTVTTEAIKITITADSASKTYNGTALTKDSWELTEGELAEGHEIESVTVTGSQTQVGESDNVPSDAKIYAPETKEDVTAAYEITYVNGKLKVNARQDDDEEVEPAVEPTKPAIEPTEPAIEPTEPAIEEPTEPAIETTEPAIEPTEPAIEEPVEEEDEDDNVVPFTPYVPYTGRTTPTEPEPAEEVEEEDDENETPLTPFTPAPVTPEPVKPEPQPEPEPEPAKGGWAVANLVLSIGTALSAAAAYIFKKKKEDEDEEATRAMTPEQKKEAEEAKEKEEKKKRNLRLAGVAVAVASAITFILTEDMTQVPVLLDKWTLLMAAYFGGDAFLTYKSRKTKDEEDKEEQAKA